MHSPHWSWGNTKEAVKEPADLHAALLPLHNSSGFHTIISLSLPPSLSRLSLSPTIFLALPGAGLPLSFRVPYSFYPHLICYPLPPPYFLLSPLSLSLLFCRQESKHWKAFAYWWSRTEWDNYQCIKVNEISRYALRYQGTQTSRE